MCGRFGATFEYPKIKPLLESPGRSLISPRYNIASSQEAPVIVRKKDRNELKPMRWGLVPSWTDDKAIGQRMINARAETLRERPSYKRLVSTQRCLIPADGFYEWRREGNYKVPMWICLKGRQPFAFAGLWDRWLDRDTGNPLYTFTIITTRPNVLMRPIHNRMPVIYDAPMGRQWLEESPDHPMILSAVLQPIPPEWMEAYEVSSLVNSPDNDSPECVKPISQTRRAARQLPLI